MEHLSSSKITLGLCVIVKNGAATLRDCFASVKGLISATVLVDTGSTDDTIEIARECGARVLELPWGGDFAAARNAALAAIGTDWVLVLDADEELDPAAHSWIRAELADPKAEGYIVPVRNYLKPWDNPLTGVFPLASAERHPRAHDAVAYVHSEVIRLFRREPDIYYVGHVHEQVEYRMIELGRPIGRAGFFIHHFGWYLIDDNGMKRKRKLYHDLLERKVKQRPDDAQTLLQYGDALCAWSGRYREGLDCFMKAAALGSKQEGLWLYIASALLKLGQLEATLIAAEQIPESAGRAGMRARMEGDALGGLSRWKEAREAFAEALSHEPESIALEAKLALVELQDGELEGGTARMKKAIARAEEQALAHTHAYPFLYAAELHAHIKQWPEALRMTQAGLAHDPELVPLQQMRLRAAVATEQLDEAAEAARQISLLVPEPRSIMRHAAILNQSGKRAAAAEVISRGLERFPVSDELQQAQRELCLPVEAISSVAS